MDDDIVSEELSECDSQWRRNMTREELIDLVMKSKLSKMQRKQFRDVILFQTQVKQTKVDDLIPGVEKKLNE